MPIIEYQKAKMMPSKPPIQKSPTIDYDKQQPYVPNQPCYNNIPPTEHEIKTARIVGTIKTYKPEKGYGFISRDDHKPDIYFNKSSLKALPKIGQRVSFVVNKTTKGLQAINVVGF